MRRRRIQTEWIGLEAITLHSLETSRVDPAAILLQPDHVILGQITELIHAQGGTPVGMFKRFGAVPNYTICLPVKNEEAVLPATLAALHASMSKAGLPGLVVFLLNDTVDQSAAMIKAWTKRFAISFVLAQVRFADRGSAPRARRIALQVGQVLAPGAPLLTTDADTCVAPGWVARSLYHLNQGTDLVCGQVDVHPEELAALPLGVRRCGEVEAAYTAAVRQLWQHWTGAAAPDPLLSAMGASLAVRSAALRAVGGLPLPPVGEDRVLAQLMAERGFRVAEATDVRVTTSLRLHGRAWGGVSDTLRQRAAEPDPLCDEKLRPVRAMHALAGRWNMLAGLPDARPRFARLLRPLAAGRRLRLSQVECELQVANALLQHTGGLVGQAVAAE